MSNFFDDGNLSAIDTDASRKKAAEMLDDDSTFNFRVNTKLKEEFLLLCKRERYSAASALKRYMLRCVEKGEVTHDFRRL